MCRKMSPSPAPSSSSEHPFDYAQGRLEHRLQTRKGFRKPFSFLMAVQQGEGMG